MRCWALRTTCAAKWLPAALALAAALPGWAAPKAAAPVVRLREAATVQGPAVRLADVAAISAPAPVAARLAEVDLGPAPTPGRSRAISAESIRIRLRGKGMDAGWVPSGGPVACTVTREAQTVAAGRIVEAARAFVEARETGGEGRLVVETISSVRDLTLPRGRLELTTEYLGTAIGATRRVAVRATVDGKAAGRADVSLRIRRMVRVAVAAETIRGEQPLGAERIRFEERDRATLPNNVFTDDADLSELVALRVIAEGAPITATMADRPALIRRGDTVQAIVRTGRIEVALPVVAVEDGRPGGWLRVRNTQSNREFRARVVDAQTVEAPAP